jgi:hypothetical protein
MDGTSGDAQLQTRRSADEDTLDLAKSYFDLKEYDRAAFFAKNLQSHAGMYLYSRVS